MVLCAVINCSNRSGVTKGVSYFSFPNVIENRGEKIKDFSKNRRKEWLSRVNRADLCEDNLKHKKVCSEHFVQGKPSDLLDVTHPDWAPSLKLGHTKFKVNSSQANDRYRRSHQRKVPVSSYTAGTTTSVTANPASSAVILPCTTNSVQASVNPVLTPASASSLPLITPCNNNSASTEHFVQTDCSMSYISQLEEEIYNLRKENDELKQKVKQLQMSFENVDDSKVQFYTGLPSVNMLQVLYGFIAPRVQYKPVSINLQQSFLIFLIKLRLNLLLQDLAYRFSISQSTVARIFSLWLEAAFLSMSPTIIWPERDALRETMPTDFIMEFGTNVVVIVDCFETMIDRPTSLNPRAATWSNYKHHNTIKFLIGISPQGVITFVSEAWGGRASDKHITENCGILEKLLPGDYVMADRGFNIGDAVGIYCAKLIKPSSARGKQQLSPYEIQQTRNLASLRIHVERVIGNLRQKYTILKGQLPIEYLTRKEGDIWTPIDKIVKVCAAFTNLSKPIVSLD